MNGKVNIVFGFIYLATTAVIGPRILVPHLGVKSKTMNEAAQVVEKVRTGMQSDFKDEANPDRVIAPAVVGIFDYLKASKKIPPAGPHVHGNLEAMLNIIVGLILLNLAISNGFKTVLSVLFLVGALFHSGMLYLGGVFGMFWAYNLTMIGSISLIAGLVLMGIASITGIKKSS